MTSFASYNWPHIAAYVAVRAPAHAHDWIRAASFVSMMGLHEVTSPGALEGAEEGAWRRHLDESSPWVFATLIAEGIAARSALVQLEWSGDPPRCPACGASKEAGHQFIGEARCPIEFALAGITLPDEKEAGRR